MYWLEDLHTGCWSRQGRGLNDNMQLFPEVQMTVSLPAVFCLSELLKTSFILTFTLECHLVFRLVHTCPWGCLIYLGAPHAGMTHRAVLGYDSRQHAMALMFPAMAH